MPAAFKPDHKAPQPRRVLFDPYNSSSTGHQHADNRLSRSGGWKNSRTLKLNAQLVAPDGGERIADLVGAGSENFGKDGRTDTGWDDSVQGHRGRQGLTGQWGDVGHLISGHTRETKMAESEPEDPYLPPPSAQRQRDDDEDDIKPIAPPTKRPRNGDGLASKAPPAKRQASAEPMERTFAKSPQIFASLVVLINGSTYPVVSDHKLKQLLISHGAQLAIQHARKQVTHVILGKPSSANDNRSNTVACGGGLAGGKLEKEILKKNLALGKGVRYVGVEWVTESIKAGKRLPESRFPGVNTAPSGVRSVKDMFETK